MMDEIFSDDPNSEQVVLDTGKIADCKAWDVSPVPPISKTVIYTAVVPPNLEGKVPYKWSIIPGTKADIIGPDDQKTVKVHGLEAGKAIIKVEITPTDQEPFIVSHPVTVVPKVVKLDPGHGGDDPGAIGPTGLKEKDINLKIALKLKAKLEAEGITVLMTRTGDQTVTKEARANEVKNDRPNLFLSIHQNSADNNNAKGTETFINRIKDPKHPTPLEQSEIDFAKKVQAKVHGVVQEENRNEGEPKGAGFTVIQNSLNGNTTSCLNEVTFINNPACEARLRDDGFLDSIAEAMKEAIMETLQ
jgi:N-acetylmuramoyl-L-alanine amidase